ncbi:MAG: LysR family transcriptional regulator [Clostridia bacterium]|nr:LysR family transcriptional regulator [Clostridia bacterium]
MFANKHYVLAIMEEGSFSKAAEKLYISQPSLSASIKRIEEKISVPLFNRSTSPVTLTEAGEEYVRHALEIEATEKNFERYIYDYANLLTGSVRIGGSSLFSSFMLPSMIYEFKKIYPNIKFEVSEDSTKNLIQKLVLGGIDIIIDNAVIDDPAINSTIYSNEMLLLAVPASYDINEKFKNFRFTANDIKNGTHMTNNSAVSLKAFSGYPFILLNPENDTGRRANLLFKKHKIEPETVFFLDQQVTAYNVSVTGMGISFVSDTLVKHTEAESKLYYYKLNDEEILRNIYFCKKQNHYLSRACQEFIDFNTKLICN